MTDSFAIPVAVNYQSDGGDVARISGGLVASPVSGGPLDLGPELVTWYRDSVNVSTLANRTGRGRSGGRRSRASELTKFKAVWSHVRQSGVAKLVTVHLFVEG
jgi:hypothetical protein